MFLKAEKEIRIFTGDFFESFVEPLKDTLSIVLKHFEKRTNSFIHIILLNSQKTKQTKEFLDTFANKNIKLVGATYNAKKWPIGHFMCVDSNIYRIEQPHPELTPESDESVIKAKVCFNDADTTKAYINIFDSIWNKLTNSK